MKRYFFLGLVSCASATRTNDMLILNKKVHEEVKGDISVWETDVTSPTPYDGYVLLAGENINTAVDPADNEDIGCLQGTDGDGQLWAAGAKATALKFMCDQDPYCQFFNEQSFKHWTADPNTDSYISTTKCSTSTKGTVSKPTCAAPSSGPSYWNCPPGVGGGFTELATYVLPPFLIKQACDQNEDCVAFTVNKINGTLFQAASPSATSQFYMKMASSTDPAVQIPIRAQSPASQKQLRDTRAFDGFHSFPGMTMSATATATPVYKQCTSAAAYKADLMNVPALKHICAGTGLCDFFVDQATPVTNSTPVWNVWGGAANANYTTYVDSSTICKPGSGACDDPSASFLECSGMDLSQGVVEMETYDLPDWMIAEACKLKSCHMFVVKNDNSTGTLYQFKAADGVTTYLNV